MKNLKISIAIPASLVSDTPHLREKTYKLGLVGRAAAIFCVDEIIVYLDMPSNNQKQEINLISTVLSYLETPQYLRKHLFKITPELRYAGILPPLRTPHHPLTNKTEKLGDGEYREGVVVACTKQGSMVDVGVEKPIIIRDKKLPINARITIKIVKTEKFIEGKIVEKEEIKTYWGYKVTVSNKPLARTIKETEFNIVIATSKFGTPFKKVAEELTRALKNSQRVLIVFGAPTKGLHDIVKYEKIRLEDITHFIINTIPEQGTETVRTEEAIFASLALIHNLVA